MTQKEVFKIKWDNSGDEGEERCCQVCGTPLGTRIEQARAFNFAHILGKGAYPRFKYLVRNIWLLCLQCHTDWDFGAKSDEKFEELRKEEQTLKELYFKPYDDTRP